MTPEPEFYQQLSRLVENINILSLALILLVIATSVAIGRSLILLANRISPWRMILSLVISAFRFLLTSAIWIFLPYYLGRYFWGSQLELKTVVAVVTIAFSPLHSAWLGLLPYFGRGIMRLLYLISFLLLFMFYILLGFGDRVFILLPLGFFLMLAINILILSPLQNFAAGRKLISDFSGFRL